MATSPRADARFRALFDAHVSAVHRYFLRRLSTDDANDAVSEVFLVAWRKIDLVPSGEAALPWLIGVARNEVRNRRRSARRALRLVAKAGAQPPEHHPDPAVQVVRAAEYRDVASALSELSTDDQEAIRLRSWEELTIAQIAVVLGCSEAAAAKRVARATARLTKAVERRQELGKGGGR